MIKIYDSNHQFLTLLDSSLKDPYTVETLSTGQKTLCFKVPCEGEFIEMIQEENYVETIDYNYIIKEVIFDNNDFITVYCQANIEDIKGTAFLVFDKLDSNIHQVYDYCLQNTEWHIEYHSKDNSLITYQLPNVSAYEMITKIAGDYDQEVWYDTKNLTVHIYDRMGKDFGAFYSNELKLKKLKKQSNSYDYFTVLTPIGKNGLTITSVNNGKSFLQNFSYTNKYLEKVWVNEDYDIPEELKKAGERHLAEISAPRASYKLALSDLGTDIAIGDTVILVDKIKKIKQNQRVVKIIRYLNAPEKDTLEISNLQVDFANQFVKSQKKTEADIKYLRELIKSLQ